MASLAAVMPSRAARSLISGAPRRSRGPEVAVEDQRLRRLHLHDQLGQLALHERVVDELGTEGLPGLGVAEGLDEGPAGAPEPHHRDAQPGPVGHLHHPGQPAAVARHATDTRSATGALGSGGSQQEPLGVGQLHLGRGHGLRAELVLEAADPHAVAGAVPPLPQDEERGDGTDRVRGALGLGQHHEGRAVGVGGEPLQAGELPGVAVAHGGRLQRGEVGAARALREHLGRFAGHLAGGEDLPDASLDVVGGELLDEADDHVAARAEGAHHPDLGLVEQVGPGRGQGRRVDAGPPGLIGEGRRAEAVGHEVAPRRLEGGRHHHPAGIPAPAVVLLQARRVPVGLLGPLGDRAADQLAEVLEVRGGPGQALGPEVAPQHPLQGGVGGVPVPADRALVALGGIAPGLLCAGEGQLVDRLDQVARHDRDATTRLPITTGGSSTTLGHWTHAALGSGDQDGVHEMPRPPTPVVSCVSKVLAGTNRFVPGPRLIRARGPGADARPGSAGLAAVGGRPEGVHRRQ